MHTYVLTSFIVNLVCIALVLVASVFTQRISGANALAIAWGVFCAIWAGSLLFA